MIVASPSNGIRACAERPTGRRELPRAASTPKSLTVSILTGCVVPRDAISNVCRQQLETIRRYGQKNRIKLDVRLYTTGSEVRDSRIAIAANPVSVAADQHFLESDVIIYHFGIFHPLFDSIHLAPPTAKLVVCYYGITSPSLVSEQQRPTLYRSYQQAVNIHAAHQVLTTSRFLSDELARMDVPADRVVQVPLPVSFQTPPAPRERRPQSDVLRLICVGRFVPAKGVLDLLQAVQEFRSKGGRFRLDLVGSKTFSDPAYLAALHTFVEEHRLGSAVRFHHDVSDERLTELLGQADALVVPSYHEGFCVPVIEALHCGCFVICSDAGALPETSGGLGSSFAARSTDDLCARLEEFVAARRRGGYSTDSGFLNAEEWRARALQYAAGFSQEQCDLRFCAAVFGDLRQTNEQVRRLLAEARRQTIVAGRESQIRAPENRKLQLCLEEVLTASGIKPAAIPSVLVTPTFTSSSAPASPNPGAAAGQRSRIRAMISSLPVIGPACRWLKRKLLSSPMARLALPGGSLVGRIRERMRRLPLFGKGLRYLRRWVYLPWNFHKFYVAFFEFQDRWVHQHEALNARQSQLETTVPRQLEALAEKMRQSSEQLQNQGRQLQRLAQLQRAVGRSTMDELCRLAEHLSRKPE